MSTPIRKLAALALLLANGLAAAAVAQPSQGGGIGAFASSDSEGFSTRRLSAAYLPVFDNGDAYSALRYGASQYKSGDWSGNAQQLSAIYRRIESATANGVQLDASLLRQNGHDLLGLDGSYHATLAKGSSVELFINRDWVETAGSLERGVHFTYAGAALEQAVGPHLTLVGMGGYQKFSDDNERKHGRVKLIFQPDLDLGLTLQLRYRMYTSSRETRGTYFNPARYDETMLAVGWRKRFQGWMGSVTAGIGRQAVGEDARTPTRLLEAGLESPVRRQQSVRLRAGLNKSASFGGPDYTYRYAQLEWLLGF